MRVASLLAWASSLLLCLAACAPPRHTQTPAPETRQDEGAAPIGALVPGEPETALPVELDDIATGSAQAKVTIVAFLDFECGFCAQGFATLDGLRRRYPASQLRIVIKHLPLDFHPQALPSAVAAQAVQLAAGPQVGFDYARRLFESRGQLGFKELAGYAEEAGVSRELYNELVADPETMRRVGADVVLSRRHGVDGTPAFFINGRLLSGAQPEEVFVALVDEEKAAMEARLASLPWERAYAERVHENTQNSLVEALLARDPHDYRVPVDGSPVAGPNDAAVTMVLFTDFECPYCKRADATVNELLRLYSGKLRLVFKHKPLSFHARARPSALLAAAIQKKKGDAAFFEAAGEMFEASPDLTTERLTVIGKRQGLSDGEITQSLIELNEAANSRVKRDGYLGDDVQTEGTPHFFINGKRLSGARPLVHFRALIDSQLKRAEQLLAAGTPAAALYETLQKDALSPGAPRKLEQIVPEAGRPTRGPQKAPVTVHVFSDFQCPFCKQAEEVLHKLDGRYPEQLRFVWHDMPLDFHERALPAALVGREAFAQKGSAGFWRMHRLLFGLDSGGVLLGREDLRSYGREIGLNMARLDKALDAPGPHPGIEADRELAASLGIVGTPAFVVGSYLVTGARPIEHFERLIELVLAESSNDANDAPRR